MKAYKVIELVQGTPEWLNLRYDHATASDAPVIQNLSPYKSKLQLFEEKVLRQEPNVKGKEFLFSRGHSAEVAGREWVTKNLDIELPPAVLVSHEVPDLMASLDGFNPSQEIIFECKYVGQAVLEEIKKGTIPATHMCQIQAQLRVTLAKKCIYFAIDPSGAAATIEILPDSKYMTEIAALSTQFMQDVRDGKAPEASDKDFFAPTDDRFKQLLELKLQADNASDQFEALKALLTNEYKEYRRIRANGLIVTRVISKGNVDYKSIPQLKGVDLDRYRKGFKESVRVAIDKKENA